MKYITIYHYGWINICGDFLDLPVGFLSLIWGISWELSGNSKVESWRRAMRSWKKMKGLRTDGVSCDDEMWSEGQRILFSCQEMRIFGGTATKQLGRCGVWMSMDHIDSGSVYESEIGSGRP